MCPLNNKLHNCLGSAKTSFNGLLKPRQEAEYDSNKAMSEEKLQMAGTVIRWEVEEEEDEEEEEEEGFLLSFWRDALAAPSISQIIFSQMWRIATMCVKVRWAVVKSLEKEINIS